MSETAEKARALRLQRLTATLQNRLENPMAAFEVLLTELTLGEQQTALWEALHAAAMRDGMEEALANAYVKTASGRRMQQLDREAQAAVLLHAADYYQGVLGDPATAENFLERIQHIVPGHPEAFARLERRLGNSGDPRRLIELYGIAASGNPAAANDLLSKALNKIIPLPATSPLSDDVCKQLASLAATYPSIIDTLDAHCRKTKRFALACALIEQALSDPNLPQNIAVKFRRRVVELYTGEAEAPAQAISHVEALIELDPTDQVARDAADRLLRVREVAGRAAAALQKARRQSR